MAKKGYAIFIFFTEESTTYMIFALACRSKGVTSVPDGCFQSWSPLSSGVT